MDELSQSPCFFNLVIKQSLHKHLNLAISLMLGQGVSMMLQLVLISHYRPVYITVFYFSNQNAFYSSSVKVYTEHGMEFFFSSI